VIIYVYHHKITTHIYNESLPTTKTNNNDNRLLFTSHGFRPNVKFPVHGQ